MGGLKPSCETANPLNYRSICFEAVIIHAAKDTGGEEMTNRPELTTCEHSGRDADLGASIHYGGKIALRKAAALERENLCLL